MPHRTSLRTILTSLCILGSACSSSGGGKGSGGQSGSSPGNSGGTTSQGGSSSGGTTSQGGSASGGVTSSGGSATGDTSATGGRASGGTTSSAGSSSGGAGASGGRTVSGGTIPTGGTTTTGGATGAAGQTGSGGSATGGASATGGTSATGGRTGSGGTVVTGGTTAAGGSGTPSNACTGTASGTAPNTLTVTPDSAQYAIKDGIFGLLMERLGKDIQGGLFVGTSSSIPNTSGMRNDVIEGFKEAGVGMLEWPGGCAANGYNWTNSKNPSNDVGTDRYMELCQILGIEPILVGPATASGAANNLAWVTYVNQNAAHPDWPALRHFKIGNEIWGGCGSGQNLATYTTNYLANYDVLSTPINGKPLKLIASSTVIISGNLDQDLDAEIKALAGKIDGIEIHDYIYHPSGATGDSIPNVGFTDAQYYNIVNSSNKGQIGPRIDQIIKILDKYDPEKRIKIYEDEWGNWLLPFNAASDGWLQQGTVMDAISSAEHLHLFMEHADRFEMAGLAQAINVIQALMLTRSSDSALVKTPTFYLFKMFLPHHRSNAKWAPNTLKSENITGNGKTFPVLSAGSSVDDQGRINISLANVDLVNTKTIQITIDGGKSSYDVSNAQVITGPEKDSYNDYAQTEKVNIQKLAASNCSISGKSLQVTLPSKSVVMLVLTPKS